MTSSYENLCLFKLGWPCDFDHQERIPPVRPSSGMGQPSDDNCRSASIQPERLSSPLRFALSARRAR